MTRYKVTRRGNDDSRPGDNISADQYIVARVVALYKEFVKQASDRASPEGIINDFSLNAFFDATSMILSGILHNHSHIVRSVGYSIEDLTLAEFLSFAEANKIPEICAKSLKQDQALEDAALIAQMRRRQVQQLHEATELNTIGEIQQLIAQLLNEFAGEVHSASDEGTGMSSRRALEMATAIEMLTRSQEQMQKTIAKSGASLNC